ncbi:MAG TPA: 23S rRNA (pseudouridine(1915)-N(3))-methyltransferase RlmH [Gemmatimonadales bacterium]
MEITLLAVGKLRPAVREVADDYIRRLGRYLRVREVEVKEAARAPTVEAQREEEGRRLGAKLAGGGVLVALAREGTQLTSRDIATHVGRWQLAARPVDLAIGGSSGLGRELLARASFRWSLGPITLPHELARVVVLEQLYRACTILSGEKYHKGG